MNRRQARYWLFRFKTEAEGGSSALEAPEGLRALYESQQIFKFVGGWVAFGGKWDIDEYDYTKIVALKESLWVSWQKLCERAAKPLPKEKARGVIPLKREDIAPGVEIDVPLVIE